jgi:hypothetical protein
MMRSIDDLKHYNLQASDGEIGLVRDLLFDDASWAVRYLVVQTGSWLSSRKVLISPIAIGQPNWEERLLPLAITREQVKSSPDIDTDKPVSRQHEIGLLGHYGFPYYWTGPGFWGTDSSSNRSMEGIGGFVALPGDARRRSEENDLRAETSEGRHSDPHLRSANAIRDYGIRANDGEIGHVQGLLVEEDTWTVRYLIVNTSNWWVGHRVLIAPAWIEEVNWFDSTISVDLTRQRVQEAPVYDFAETLNRQQEVRLLEHYGRGACWTGKIPAAPKAAEDLKVRSPGGDG